MAITGMYELTVQEVLDIERALEHYIKHLGDTPEAKRYKATLAHISKNPYDKPHEPRIEESGEYRPDYDQLIKGELAAMAEKAERDRKKGEIFAKLGRREVRDGNG